MMEYKIDYRKANLHIDLTLHLLISWLLAYLIYWQFHSLKLSALCLLSGIFIDLDHLMDYFIHFGMRFRWSEFFRLEYLKSGKAYVFLHSWEILIGFSLLAADYKMTLPIVAISLGFIGHLLVDHFREIEPFSYFLTYRIIHNFKLEKFHPKIISNLDLKDDTHR